jgi:uncharacterized protein YjbI with pentapeptide repeats
MGAPRGLDVKSRFHGRKVDARIFLAEAIRGERNFTDSDLSKCDLAAHPQHVEKFNKSMLDRCVPPTDVAYQELSKGDWLNLDKYHIDRILETYDRNFQHERFYFTQANMSGFCAIGMWFPMVDLRYTYMDSADFTECFMPKALFDDAEGPSMIMQHADLRGAAFHGGRFLKANLTGSSMQGSRLIQSSFVNSNFDSANLEGSVIENTDLSGCDFSRSSLLKVEGLVSATWSGAKFACTKVSPEDAQKIKTKRELDDLDMCTPEHRALRKGR